ncbi:ArsR/SmtB family transcription factor [Rhodospira trueperi]|uniref:DNA-binding transcriptional regulator, ArsR family n=1 Tax=Rhodospira trueperi TaxID=69960 RepID=A0A1G7FIX6_9PROT|nr:metalloregulator ArsR/SmtB family transcription factor [Rhodospira trueperi]SDE75861.1 DNA-binding transcriptional regulator, ArsR family [Rhodospira trueperi]
MTEDDLQKLQEQARGASTLLKAMSNQYRLLILCQLHGNECSVGELERVVGLSQSALSQHLARLRRDDLVRTRRVAQTIYYSLKGDEVAAILGTLYTIYCAPRAAAPGDVPKPAGEGCGASAASPAGAG